MRLPLIIPGRGAWLPELDAGYGSQCITPCLPYSILAESDGCIEVNGKRNRDAAWYYPDPKPAAKQIQGYVAFWKGVSVEQ